MSRTYRPWYMYVSELGGLGQLPIAPGTWGSFGAALFYWGLVYVGTPVELLGGITLLLLPGTVPVCNWSSLYMARKDPSNVVLDELIGQWIALFPVFWTAGVFEAQYQGVLLGFLLFRGFDIFTIFPANKLEAISGGWGIVLDDCMAGIYAGASYLILVRYIG